MADLLSVNFPSTSIAQDANREYLDITFPCMTEVTEIRL